MSSTHASSAAGPGSLSGIAAAAASARAGWEAENRAAAERLVAAHQLMAECLEHPDCLADPDRPGFTVVDPEVMAASHLVRMFPVSTLKAATMLDFAADLHFRYPAILEAMLEGRMDLVAAVMLARQMINVDASVVHQVQRDVVDAYLAAVEGGERPGPKEMCRRVDGIISGHDPDAVRQRKQDAGREREARISRGRDGMSTFFALLHSDEAAILAEALDEKVAADRVAEEEAAAAAAAETAATAGQDASASAEAGTGGGEEAVSDEELDRRADLGNYSIGQRRADALMSLVCGDPSPGAPDGTTDTDTDSTADTADTAGAADSSATDSAGPAGSAAGGRSGVTLRPKVTVIAPGGGLGRASVEFARTGEAALQCLLDMLAASDGASLEYLDPAHGAADDPADALRYRPSAALARRIRLRDGTCRHPGCHVPAESCDLDHLVPFNPDDPASGGKTVESNLVCLCRKHHRFKTFNDWNYHLAPDGTLTLTTPDGHTVTTRPAEPLADYRREQQQFEAQAWARQQRRNPGAGDGTGADAVEHAEQSAWARREARKARRRQTQREANAADRAARTASKTDPADRAARDAGRTAPTHDEDVDWVEEYRIKHRGGFAPIVITGKPYVINLTAGNYDALKHDSDNRARYGGNPGPHWHDQILQDLHDLLNDPPPF